jgi:hypothetical protein
MTLVAPDPFTAPNGQLSDSATSVTTAEGL